MCYVGVSRWLDGCLVDLCQKSLGVCRWLGGGWSVVKKFLGASRWFDGWLVDLCKSFFGWIYAHRFFTILAKLGMHAQH